MYNLYKNASHPRKYRYALVNTCNSKVKYRDNLCQLLPFSSLIGLTTEFSDDVFEFQKSFKSQEEFVNYFAEEFI